MSTRYKAKVLENFNVLASERSSRSGSTSTSSKLKHEEQLENINPYLQRQLDLLGNKKNTKFLVREKQSFGSQALQFANFLDKLTWKNKNWAFKQLEKRESPLVFTQCPRCEYIGLNLLTSSTKEQFSPTFCSKIKQILPSTKRISNSNKNLRENQGFCFNSHKYQEKVVEKVPILNISRMKLKKNMLEAVRVLEKIKFERKKWAFEYIYQYESSVIEYDSEVLEKGVERKYTFGYMPEEYSYQKPKEPRLFEKSFYLDYPSPTLSQKTAFKILYSRIKKLIFRRKLRVFISLSKVY